MTEDEGVKYDGAVHKRGVCGLSGHWYFVAIVRESKDAFACNKRTGVDELVVGRAPMIVESTTCPLSLEPPAKAPMLYDLLPRALRITMEKLWSGQTDSLRIKNHFGA